MAKTRYRTSDLELVSPVPLDGLRGEFERHGLYRVSDHRRGEFWFEAYETVDDRPTPEMGVEEFLRAIEQLSPSAAAAFAACSSRALDLAFDVGDDRERVTGGLSVGCLAGLAKWNVEVHWTFYADDEG